MEDLLDKLKLLNYEEVSLKSISDKKILHKNLVEAKICKNYPTEKWGNSSKFLPTYPNFYAILAATLVFSKKFVYIFCSPLSKYKVDFQSR